MCIGKNLAIQHHKTGIPIQYIGIHCHTESNYSMAKEIMIQGLKLIENKSDVIDYETFALKKLRLGLG